MHPALPREVRADARAEADRLNAAICALTADGNEISRLAGATIGTEVAADLLEVLVVREKLRGTSMEIESLTDRVLAALTQAGRSIQQDGKAVQDMAHARESGAEVGQADTGTQASDTGAAWGDCGLGTRQPGYLADISFDTIKYFCDRSARRGFTKCY